MAPKTQSAKTPVTGPPTTGIRKPLANTPVTTRHRADPRVAAAPPCYLRGRSMVRVCPIKARHFVAGFTQMRQMRHITDSENAFLATTSVPSVPFPDTIPPHAVVHTETKPVHHVSPHAQPSIPMPPQADRIQRRHKCTGISYENVNSYVNPLTTAKLTRSCAGANPGTIKCIQFMTGIASKVNERCKNLALEHHKRHKMRDVQGQRCRLSCQDLPQSGKGLPRGLEPAPDLIRG